MPVPLVAAAALGGKVLGIVKGFGIGGGGPSGTTHAARTLAAADGSATQRTLVQQAWGHVLQARAGSISDAGYWLQVWQELLSNGTPTLHQVMGAVSGETVGAPEASFASLPSSPSTPSTPSGPATMRGSGSVFGGDTRTLLIGVALVVVILFVFLKGR